MSEVFADAGYWVAMLDARDRLHDRARAVTATLGTRRIVTTHMVLAEVLNLMASAGEHRRQRAWELAQGLERDTDVVVVPQADTQFTAALERYASRGDQTWGLTDCASFLVMEERTITEALAYDRDFEQAGFTALLREGRA